MTLAMIMLYINRIIPFCVHSFRPKQVLKKPNEPNSHNIKCVDNTKAAMIELAVRNSKQK